MTIKEKAGECSAITLAAGWSKHTQNKIGR